MDVTRYPSVDVPVVMVSIANPGAPANAMEEEVAALRWRMTFYESRGTHVYATVAQGLAVITAEFTINTDSAAALTKNRAGPRPRQGHATRDWRSPRPS